MRFNPRIVASTLIVLIVLAFGLIAGVLFTQKEFIILGPLDAADVGSFVVSLIAVVVSGIGFMANTVRYYEERKLERPLFSLYEMSVQPPTESFAEETFIEMAFAFRNIGRRSAEEIVIRSLRAHETVQDDEVSIANRVDANGVIRKIVHIPAYVQTDGQVYAGKMPSVDEEVSGAKPGHKEVRLHLAVAYVDMASGNHHTDEFWVSYTTGSSLLRHSTTDEKEKLQADLSGAEWKVG
jgi:hypothetical protein